VLAAALLVNSTGALGAGPRAGPAKHEDPLCGFVKGASWTAAGRSGTRWFVAASDVSCAFAKFWAARLSRARIIRLGNGHEYFSPKTLVPTGFGCVPKTLAIPGVRPYAEGVCEKRAGKIGVAFTWGITHP
jgi:hypothetical protein